MDVQYRLLSLEFRNGQPDNNRRLGFANATLHQNSFLRMCTIKNVGMPPDVRADTLEEWFFPFEVETIRYQIFAGDHAPIPFCHPFKRGAGVYLREFRRGSAQRQDGMYLARQGNRNFFSNNFTLDGVSDGNIDSQQKVYQFHE